jgi:hypothetical protein
MKINIRIKGEMTPVLIQESLITDCWDVIVGEFCAVVEKNSPWHVIVQTVEEILV